MIEINGRSATQSIDLLDTIRDELDAPVPILKVITDHSSEFNNTHQDDWPCLDHVSNAACVTLP
jgi:hypothetical protein